MNDPQYCYFCNRITASKNWDCIYCGFSKRHRHKGDFMSFKVGDKVYHSDSDNSLYFAGILSEIHCDDEGNEVEADLEFTTGGSVSPVSLSCCEHISDALFTYLKHLEKVSYEIAVIAEENLGMRPYEG